MAKKTLTATLSVSSIKNLQKQLQDYQKDLTRKCEEFVRRLAESGIEVAKHHMGNFGHYITFSIKTESNKDGCKSILMATNTGIIHSEWRTKKGVKSADVSLLLMCEFGSGLKAENPKNISGVGTGTFPGQIHAKDPSGWWYMDLDGEWHHSKGITPKMPMYKATIEIVNKIQKIAEEVFDS